MDDSQSYYERFVLFTRSSIIDLNTFERENRYHSIWIREMARDGGVLTILINQKSEREMFEAKFPFENESSARRQLHRGHDSCRPHNTRRTRIKCSTWPDAKDFNWLAREIHADVVIPRPSETPTRVVSNVMGFCVCIWVYHLQCSTTTTDVISQSVSTFYRFDV
jgi:hypothetical protein